jgi:hypothetical protein
MNPKLSEVLKNISDEYREKISTAPGTRNYLEVDIGERAGKLGFPDLQNQYRRVNAVVPLKDDGPGMRVRIDGRTFVNYALYDFGVAVPGYVAKEAGLPYKTFVPNDSMILNF